MIKFTLKNAIETAIKAEELGINFYSKLSKRFIDNKEIHNVFDLLAKDEVEHKKQFMNLLDSVADQTFEISENDIMFLNVCDISKYFPNMETISEEISATEVLKQSFNFEKDSVLYYTGIKDVIGSNQVIDEIINREKTHMVKLMRYLLDNNKFRGIEDNY